MYFNLALMLALATGAAVFVAAQVQTYVAAAVREMQTRREHDRLKRDLDIAGEIQQGLLPHHIAQRSALNRFAHFDDDGIALSRRLRIVRNSVGIHRPGG